MEEFNFIIKEFLKNLPAFKEDDFKSLFFDEKQSLAKFIDHTKLKAQTTENEIKILCQEAKKFGFYSVCLNSSYIKFANEMLENSPVKICSVVGFPLGACSTKVKITEAQEAFDTGVSEIDVVLNIGKLLDGNFDYIFSEVSKLVKLAHDNKGKIKLIIETCLLNDEQKLLACIVAKETGVDFVKTSTGYSLSGAKLEDIYLMKQFLGEKVKIKASGGIKDKETLIMMLKVGAKRIGTSNGIALINQK